jgi:pimeloyl-ACP methyl ester carboxylesterase
VVSFGAENVLPQSTRFAMMENEKLILLHGAGLGAWIWNKVEPMLQVKSIAVDFPNRDNYRADHTLTLDDYCEAVHREIGQSSRTKVILVAHSIAGIVASRLSAELGQRLSAFVGIGAVIPKKGGSFLSAMPFMQRAITWGMMSVGGTRPPDSLILKSYCNDLTREEADMVLTRYVPESMLLYTQAAGHQLPASIPKFYIRLEKDRSVAPDLQQQMIKNLDADRVVSVQAGHLAMISEPQKLANVLNGFFDHHEPKPEAKSSPEPVYP